MNGFEWPWLAPAVALVMVCALTPVVRRLLVARQWLDYPDDRRQHDRPTPRGGGLAVLAGLAVALGILTRFDAGLWLLVGLVLALGGLGWLDDRYELSVRWRFLVQLAIAIVMVIVAGGITELRLGPWLLASDWLWNVLAVIAAVWLINLHNFMDGADGLASMQAVWTGLAFGAAFAWSGQEIEAVVACSLAAAFAGFLIWNRPPARIFMGDSGSILLGGVVAWLAIAAAGKDGPGVAISSLICLVFVVDATATLLRRLIRGERWYTPHRQHAYQTLIGRGWRPGRVLALYASVNLGLILPAMIVAMVYPASDFWLAAGLAGVLVLGWWVVQSAEEGENETHD